jgi:hypothetical protein
LSSKRGLPSGGNLKIVFFFLANAEKNAAVRLSKIVAELWSASASALITTAIFVGEYAVSRARLPQHVYTLAFVLNMAALVEQLARLRLVSVTNRQRFGARSGFFTGKSAKYLRPESTSRGAK